MISTKALIAAKVDYSDNWWLEPIWALVQEYNRQADDKREAGKQEKVEILERILTGVAYWITDKPPKNTNTNKARWDAMQKLAEDVAFEAQQLGVRFLTGPADWRNVVGRPTAAQPEKQRHYWLELLDPDHRPGYVLSAKFETWLQQGSPNQSFWNFVGTANHWDDKVKYYGGTAKADKRRVKFVGGVLHSQHPMHGGVFSTQDLTTVFSGQGWGIFVVDFAGNLYIHKHKEGEFHHSTFLSGGAVQCAGEIVVESGVVRVITAKTGHYASTPREMDRLLSLFPQIPPLCIIRADFRDTQGGGTPRFRLVKEYRFVKEAERKVLKRQAILDAVPAWAQNPGTKFMSEVATVPA